MFWKFLKHELSAFGNSIVNFFLGLLSLYLNIFMMGAVISLVLLPICCLLGAIPGWVFWLELLGLFIFFMYRRYLKFSNKTAEERKTSTDTEDDDDDEDEDIDEESDHDERNSRVKFVILGIAIIIILVLIPILCLFGVIPGWIFLLEVLGIIIFSIYKKKLNSSDESAEELEIEAEEEEVVDDDDLFGDDDDIFHDDDDEEHA